MHDLAAVAASLQFFVGSWTCSFQTPDGVVHRPLIQTIAPANGWMKGVIDGTEAGAPPFHQDFYIGYDARRSEWAYAVFDRGGYQLLVSPSAELNGSIWSDAYPPATGTGVFTEVSPTEYTIVSSWKDGGKTVSTREDCRKP
jgi:hypothetical protein